jgi:hypothetical protein
MRKGTPRSRNACLEAGLEPALRPGRSVSLPTGILGCPVDDGFGILGDNAHQGRRTAAGRCKLRPTGCSDGRRENKRDEEGAGTLALPLESM